MRKWLINTVIVAVVVAIFGIAFYVGNQQATDGAESFAGTDSLATEQIEQDHAYEPWFGPLFEPSSGEIESGLFALQAGLGGAVLGFALGALWRGRHLSRAAAARPSEPTEPTDSAVPHQPNTADTSS